MSTDPRRRGGRLGRWYRDGRATPDLPASGTGATQQRAQALSVALPPFRRAVLALNGGESDSRIVRLAAEYARSTKAELVAVHVVEIDWTLPLDADIAGRSEEVQRVLDVAEAAAESAKVTLESVLLQARDVAAALVDEATEREADLLVLGLPYRKRFGGDFAIGRTIPYVLKNAPCAVWVVRDPMTEEQP